MHLQLSLSLLQNVIHTHILLNHVLLMNYIIMYQQYENREGGRGNFGGRGRGGYRSRGRGGGFSSPDGGNGPGGRHMFKKSYSEEAKEQVDQIYSKKFKFQDIYEQWTLPEHSNFFSHKETPEQLSKLLQLKDQLNKMKAKLDSKDVSYWDRHTDFTNRTAIVTPMLRRDYSPEMCTKVSILICVFI